MIVDDGSTDSTAGLVKKWQKEGKIEIIYLFQPNAGMLAAHETAYQNILTELCVCIDSDDWLPNDSVEKMIAAWKVNINPACCGIIGLDAYKDGKTVGSEFPISPWKCKFTDFFLNGVFGDKKFVHRTEIIRKFLPYPKFEGEKFPVTSYLYYAMGDKYHYVAYNEIFCYIEYQQDGLSQNLISQYRKSPRSFAEFRLTAMKYLPAFSLKFKHAVHLNASVLLSGDCTFLRRTPYPLLSVLAFPAGILLYFYIRFTSSTSVNKHLNRS